MDSKHELDLSMIAEVMNSSNMEGYIDPRTGEVHVGMDGEFFDAEGNVAHLDPYDLVEIPDGNTSDAYEDMVAFAEMLPAGRRQSELLDALEGRGAFRRFKDRVHTGDDMLGRTFSRFADTRTQLRALDWLREDSLITEDEFRTLSEQREAVLDEIREELSATTSRDTDAVAALERELQTAECRADAARVDALLAADFEEIGASGRRWTRTEILALLADESDAAEIEMSDLRTDLLGEDLALVQWESRRGERRARRTSLWRREDGGWRLRHHQGTLLP